MNDKQHWRELIPGEHLGAWSLRGEDRVLTIKSVAREVVTGTTGKKENLMVIRWVEDELPMVCNSTNAKVIAKLYTSYPAAWIGKKIQLYPTTTKFGGEIVECIRVRPTAPKPPKAIKCEGCGKQIAAAANMSAEQLAEYTKAKYGKPLCSACATKARSEQAGENK